MLENIYVAMCCYDLLCFASSSRITTYNNLYETYKSILKTIYVAMCWYDLLCFASFCSYNNL